MEYPPQAFEFSTLVLLAQTFIEIAVNAFRNPKKTKQKMTLRSILDHVVVLGIVICVIFYFVFFFDFGYRSLVILLYEGGLSQNQSKLLVIVGYYIGYNSRKISATIRGKKLNDDHWFNNLFVNTPLAVLVSILLGFFVVYLKNILHLF